MARKRNRGSVQRDTTVIANPGLLDLEATPRSFVKLSQIEDRRTFSPGVYRPARTFRGWSRLAIANPKKAAPFRAQSRQFSPVVRFGVPEETLVCVRRHRRREVLFAKNKTRKGAGSRRRRNSWSGYSCKR